jgi:hypothetical protein
MIAQVGDVLVIPYFPHKENKSEGEPRYVIIVEDLGNELLMIGFTSQLHQLHHYPDGFIIRESSAEGRQMGLDQDSIICCGRLGVRKEARLPKKFLSIPPIIKKGTCPEDLLDKIMLLCP